jgi:hypothetical protein
MCFYHASAVNESDVTFYNNTLKYLYTDIFNDFSLSYKFFDLEVFINLKILSKELNL